MKCAFLAVLIVAAGLPAAAQRGPGLAAHIPFSFELADTVMPAGDYRLTYETALPGVILLEHGDLRHSAFALAGPLPRGEKNPGGTYLAFNRYEDRHFLSKIMFLDRNCEVKKSKSERVMVTSKMVKVASARPVEVKITAFTR